MLPTSSHFKSAIDITNTKSDSLEIWFEPWGHSLSLLPGKSIHVDAVSIQRGSLEVVEEDDLTAVYGWSKCSLYIYEEEELIFDLFELPDLGDDPSPRKVVEMLFGGPGGPK